MCHSCYYTVQAVCKKIHKNERLLFLEGIWVAVLQHGAGGFFVQISRGMGDCHQAGVCAGLFGRGKQRIMANHDG